MTLEVPALAVAVVVLVVLGLLVGLWLAWTATRLDALHLRCEVARATVEEQALRRAVSAHELAAGGGLDPASALLLADAAATAHEATGDDRWQAESDLTAALRLVSPLDLAAASPQGRRAGAEVVDASRRLSMARRIHNDLVATTANLRSRRRVRWFRLGGRAPAPATIPFDDRVPTVQSPHGSSS